MNHYLALFITMDLFSTLAGRDSVVQRGECFFPRFDFCYHCKSQGAVIHCSVSQLQPRDGYNGISYQAVELSKKSLWQNLLHRSPTRIFYQNKLWLCFRLLQLAV